MNRLVPSRDLLQRSLLRSLQLLCLSFTVWQTGSASYAQVEENDRIDTAAFIERLKETNLINRYEILAQLKLVGAKPQPKSNPNPHPSRNFSTANPYKPRYQWSFENFADDASMLPQKERSYDVNASKRRITFFGQEPVFKWFRSLSTNHDVCGLRFLDSHRRDYELKTFPDAADAIASDFVITHRYHCGTCSSLKNLAIYLAKPDLTAPARSCARRLTLGGIKQCLIETIGFEEQCAETWAYNVAHTKRQCIATCVKHYGLWNVIRNDMGNSHTDAAGELNPCLACDENISGPGFQYAAGRTRRASGLKSAIERPTVAIYSIDHSLYFE